MEFIEKIINTLKKPKEAIEEITSTPLIEEAVMIVGIYALLSAAAAYIQSSKMVVIVEGAPLMNSEFGATIGIIGAIIFAFITWFILSGIIHTISLALGGKGRFYPHMMVLVGFAMLPLIFSGIISTVIVSTAEPSTVTISLANPSAAQQAVRDIQSRPPYLASTIINSMAWIWSLAIIYLGLKTYQNLSQEKALIAVAIPLVIMLFMTFGFR